MNGERRHRDEAAEALMRHGRWIALAGLAGLLIAAGYALTRPPYFVANSSVVAGGRSQGIASQFSGLAARLGVDVGGGGDAASPAFAAGILASAPVMQELATRLDVERKDVERRLRVMPVPVSGIIRIEARGDTREDAYGLVSAWLSVADSLARNIRQQRASEEGEFLDERLKNVRDQLNAAESRLEEFHSENRLFDRSPSLLIREARIQREVQMHTGVFQQLSELYESARIEQFRDTPTFAVLGSIVLEEQDAGVVSAALAGAVLASLLAAAGILGWSFIRTNRD